jgi:hypothetical protein
VLVELPSYPTQYPYPTAVVMFPAYPTQLPYPTAQVILPAYPTQLPYPTAQVILPAYPTQLPYPTLSVDFSGMPPVTVDTSAMEAALVTVQGQLMGVSNAAGCETYGVAYHQAPYGGAISVEPCRAVAASATLVAGLADLQSLGTVEVAGIQAIGTTVAGAGAGGVAVAIADLGADVRSVVDVLRTPVVDIAPLATSVSGASGQLAEVVQALRTPTGGWVENQVTVRPTYQAAVNATVAAAVAVRVAPIVAWQGEVGALSVVDSCASVPTWTTPAWLGGGTYPIVPAWFSTLWCPWRSLAGDVFRAFAVLALVPRFVRLFARGGA